MINIHLSDDGEDTRVSEHCIRRLIRRLDPIITRIKKRAQSSSLHYDWRCARYNWVRQLLVRMELYKTTESDFINGLLPQWLDTRVLRDKGYLFSIDQVVFYDEMHQKAVEGLAALNDKQIRFYREKASSKLIHSIEVEHYEDGEVYINDEVTQAAYKFPKELRICFGVASVIIIKDDGTEERIGKRCGLFNYSEKRLIDMTEFNAKVKVRLNFTTYIYFKNILILHRCTYLCCQLFG